MTEHSEEKVNEFNNAALTNFRFHQIKELCHEARLQGDFKTWLNGLYAFYVEIYPQLADEKQTAIRASLKDAREKIKEKSFDKNGVFDTMFDVECTLEKAWDLSGGKFSYAQKQREFSYDTEEMKELLKMSGGNKWVKMENK